jgi:hypothetical protein
VSEKKIAAQRVLKSEFSIYTLKYPCSNLQNAFPLFFLIFDSNQACKIIEEQGLSEI